MYLHLGQNVMVRDGDILGIFDLDNTSWSFRTRRFLERAEREGRVFPVGEDLPRSVVLTQGGGEEAKVYLTPLSPAALAARGSRNLPI